MPSNGRLPLSEVYPEKKTTGFLLEGAIHLKRELKSK